MLNGFPVWQMTVLCIMRFSEPLIFTTLFPFLYFLIKSYDVAESDKAISKYSGYLTATFAFWQFMFCIYWGEVSDRLGRKIVLIIGLSGSCVGMLLFAFAKTFWVAFFARSLAGALNGNISTLRVMIGEIATKKEHQAVAFSTLPLLWNIGCMIGPMIGSYFTRIPDLDRPHAEGVSDFMDRYPFALSSVIVSGFLFFSIIVCILFLEETHYELKHRRDYGLELGDWLISLVGVKTPVRPWQKTSENTETAPLLPTTLSNSSAVSISSELSEEDLVVHPVSKQDLERRRLSEAIIRRYSSNRSLAAEVSRSTNSNSVWSVFKNRSIFTLQVIQTMVSTFTLSFHNLIFVEFLPIFLAGDLDVSEFSFPLRSSGGFGWDTHKIGLLLSTCGLILCLVTMVIFPLLDRYTKLIKSYRVINAIFPFIYLNLAFMLFTLPQYNSKFSPNLSLTLIYINNVVGCLASGNAFPQAMLLLHRAAPFKYRAIINSTNLSITSFARFMAPLLWGALMTQFDKWRIIGLSWALLSVLAIAGFAITFFMEEQDEDLKDGRLIEEET